MSAKVIVYMAVSKNRVIGNSKNPPLFLPWKKLKGDLPRFKKTTLGNPILMGRQTAEIFGKPLPGRTNIPLSRNTKWRPPEGFIRPLTLSQAIMNYRAECEKIFIIGGAGVLQSAFKENVIDEMILTETHDDYEGDVLFPQWDRMLWEETQRLPFKEYGYDVVHYKPLR